MFSFKYTTAPKQALHLRYFNILRGVKSTSRGRFVRDSRVTVKPGVITSVTQTMPYSFTSDLESEKILVPPRFPRE